MTDDKTVNKPHITTAKKAAMLKALLKTKGLVTQAAALAGMERSAHYRWMKEDPEYAKEVETLNNVVLDFVESAHFDKIEEGDSANIIFHLKCRGKARGYLERQAIDNTIKFESKEDEDFLKDASKKDLEEIKNKVESVDASLKNLTNVEEVKK